MKKKYIILIFVFAIILAFYYIFENNLLQYLALDNIEKLKNILISYGIITPLVMILLMIIGNILGISTVTFSILSGYLYGLFYGFLLAWIGVIIAFTIVFINSRYLFHDFFIKVFKKNILVQKVESYIVKYNIWAAIILRAVYVIPSGILNYAFSFTSIKLSNYVVGSAIGFIPVISINVSFGYLINIGLENGFEGERFYYILGLIISFLCIIFLAKFFLERKKDGNRSL